jgi:uncharacterized Zn finger protein
MTITLRALADRRSATRLSAPTCLQCADGGLTVGVIRTTRFVYFRCQTCGDVQPKLMPAVTLPHGLVARFSD